MRHIIVGQIGVAILLPSLGGVRIEEIHFLIDDFILVKVRTVDSSNSLVTNELLALMHYASSVAMPSDRPRMV